MSELLKQLFVSGEIFRHTWITIWLTFLSTILAYLLGLPIGVLLAETDKDGLFPCAPLNRAVGLIVNILRSMPFVILMVAFLPVAKFLVGTSSGNWAMLVMLVIAAAPYVARIVESSLKEVDRGVIEAARSMGASNFEIILKVLLPEARPSLIVGAVISLVTILGYSAMASTIGGDGLGKVAIIYGHQRFHEDIIWVCVLFTVVIVQVIQEFGIFIAHKLDKRIRKSKKEKKNTPYLENFNEENKTHIVSVGKIHYEPFGVFGKNVSSEDFENTKTGRTILVPGDGTNCTRALMTLQDCGYLTLKEGVSAFDALSDKDIEDSKGNEVVLVEASNLPAQLKNSDDGTIAVINGNYAIEAGLRLSDALAVEDASGETAQVYANIVAVKAGEEESAKTKALLKVLKTKKVYDFITSHFEGAVLPAFTV